MRHRITKYNIKISIKKSRRHLLSDKPLKALLATEIKALTSVKITLYKLVG